MIVALRRAGLLATLVALAVTPKLWPIPAVFGPDPSVDATGWFLALVFSTLWSVLCVWNVVQELPKLERPGALGQRLPWLAAAALGVSMVVARFALRSGLPKPDPEAYASAVGLSGEVVAYAAMMIAAISLTLPALVVLASFYTRRPILASKVGLYRWTAAVAFVTLLTPPFFGFAKVGALLLFIVSTGVMWAEEFPRFEARRSKHKWAVRFAALGLGLTLALLCTRMPSEHNLFVLHFMACVVFVGAGLAFVVVCASVADGVALALRRSSAVRERLLVLGLCSAALAFGVADLDLPTFATDGSGRLVVLPVLSLVVKVVVVGTMVLVFSTTLSRRLSQSLEQSVLAMTEIQRGNLDVALDESGRDEVAEVARSVNGMVAQLREAEFLEKINADLRARSDSLARTLDALKTAQAELVRSERMASVATLVRGIAHELNNPINYIAGNTAPLERYCAFLTRVASELSDGRARSSAELRLLTRLTDKKDLGFVTEDLARLTADISEGARRAQLIIMDLQNLTSAAQRGVEQVDLHVVARQTLSLLEPRRPPGVRLQTKLEEAPTVAARAGQLEQVLVNLTDNALRAVGEEGTVTIHVGTKEGEVFLRVSDDGPGMTEDVKRQALEPFFTTRPAGEGSGLGLAIVASIVRAHHGRLTLESEPGRGTTVEVRLPKVADAILRAEQARPNTAARVDADSASAEGSN